MNKLHNLLFVCTLLVFQSMPAFCDTHNCTKSIFAPLNQNPVEVSVNSGNTNDDPTFNGIEPFVDLDISNSENVLSTCVFKNNSARAFSINPENGQISLFNNSAATDEVSAQNQGATRGICSLSPDGNQIFFPGIGPSEFGFDRIYPYEINAQRFNRTQDMNMDDFFIPSDLPSSLTVTPNGKFLVYLEANTSNNNLASIQSVRIKENMSIDNSFRGQALAKTAQAGTFIEFAKSLDTDKSKFVYGVFSDLMHGKSGSTKSFGIFKTQQQSGTNIILAEFKKGDGDHPLPDLFNSPFFSGISGIKIIEKDQDFYLIVSYYENDINHGFPGFSYVTKLALFKINIRSTLAKTANLAQIGSPLVTVFKKEPCSENNFYGIAGPVSVLDDIVYIADNKEGNYLAAFSIDWDKVPDATNDTKIFKPSSVPVKTSERNTDIVIAQNKKFTYIATSKITEPSNPKIFGYKIQNTNIDCQSLKDYLIMQGICDLTALPPSPIPPIPPSPSPPPPSPILPIPPSPTLPPPSPAEGRPPEFGSTGSLEPPKPQSPVETSVMLEPPKPSLPMISEPTPPIIQIIPSDTSTLGSDISQDIDIMSLDLSGSDQVIIPPNIPHIILPTIQAKTTKPKGLTTDQVPIETDEIRGATKGGTAGFVILIKEGIKLKEKDLKNLIFALINKDNKLTTIQAKSFYILPDKILVKLTLPKDLTSGINTLATLLNKGGGKKQVISKGKIKIFDPFDFKNVSVFSGKKFQMGFPELNKIEGQITGDSREGGKLMRLTFFGKNFGSKLIEINNELFIAKPQRTHTVITFTDEMKVDIIRIRVLPKGRKALVTLRFKGDDISKIPLTISTPKGQLFRNKTEIKLLSKKESKGVLLEIDKKENK